MINDSQQGATPSRAVWESGQLRETHSDVTGCVDLSSCVSRFSLWLVLSLFWLCPALASVKSHCCSGKPQTDRNSLFSGAACQWSWDGKWRKGKAGKKKKVNKAWDCLAPQVDTSEKARWPWTLTLIAMTPVLSDHGFLCEMFALSACNKNKGVYRLGYGLSTNFNCLELIKLASGVCVCVWGVA